MNVIRKILDWKTSYFLLCYLAASVIDYLLLVMCWGQGNDQPLLLAVFWPFYLGAIASDMLTPHAAQHNGITIMVHSEVFYSILLLAFAFGMGYMVRRGLRADRRRRGMWLVLAGLLLPANLTYLILS